VAKYFLHNPTKKILRGEAAETSGK